jgi:nicotinamide-nucleotide amidase
VITGGLGPTDDDRTKEAVAHVFGRALVRDEEILARLVERFRKRGITMPKVNEKQADVIEGAVVLPNPRGSAPGYLLEAGGRTVVLLPGVPVEMKGMWTDGARPLLARGTDGRGLHLRILKTAGLPESLVEERVRPVYEAHPDVPFTILASPGEVVLQFAARGTKAEAAELLDRLESDFRKALGADIFGRDEENPGRVVGDLASRAFTLAAAETARAAACGAHHRRPGSPITLGARVTYANEAKREIAYVAEETLLRHGAVSEESAREMAAGARRRFSSTVALAITGVAGPGGGTPEKPVGTVHIALDASDGTRAHRKVMLPGERAMIRRWTTALALLLLRQYLMGRLETGRT